MSTIESGLEPGAPVVRVEAFRCSDMSVHPTQMIAERHEAELVQEQLFTDFKNTLKREVEESMIDARLDEGDCAVIAQRLMKHFTFARKVN